jgi:hypothetical protein
MTTSTRRRYSRSQDGRDANHARQQGARQQKVEVLTTQLHETIEALVSSEQWLAMLRTAAMFHRYSINNVVALHAQAQARGTVITRVAGFHRWKQLGRVVRRGERAYGVLAPLKRRLSLEQARYREAEGERGFDYDGQPAMVIGGWRVEAVFDVAQPDPLPGAVDIAGDIAGPMPNPGGRRDPDVAAGSHGRPQRREHGRDPAVPGARNAWPLSPANRSPGRSPVRNRPPATPAGPPDISPARGESTPRQCE